MFDMDEFLKDLDDQNSALESMLSELNVDTDTYDEYDEAMEGLFKKPKSVDKLLASLNKTISKKCKTAEDCDAMLESISSEEGAFNDALTAMKEAAQAFKEGTITKKEMHAKIKPEAKKLKKTCSILKLSDINDKTDNVTDEELQNLRDFLVGAKEAIAAKKEELSGSATESFVGDPDDDDNDMDTFEPATEAAGVAAVAIGAYVALFSTLIALGLNFDKNGKICRKMIKTVTKQIKPQMKKLKADLKMAKKNKNWAKCASVLKEMKTCNDKMKTITDKLTTERETGEVTTDRNGGNAKVKKIKTFNMAVASAKAKYEQEDEYIRNQIIFYTEKAKASGPANEAALFMDGFNAAIEAMMMDDDCDLDESALESKFDDIAGEIPDLFDDEDGDLTI